MLTDYQSFIHASRYARFQPLYGRRELPNETTMRYLEYMQEHLEQSHNYIMPVSLVAELEDGINDHLIMPSMRAMMTAGPALRRCHVAAYNCSYSPVDSPRAFDEAMYILMCGTGFGFSVERQYVNQLPVVNEHFERSLTTIAVDDSKAGWARAFRELIAMLYAGQIPNWDTSKVRPAGSILKTFGGRASGPEPLEELFEFCVRVFRNAAGRKLTSLECHDIMCKIGEIVVVGGVRRSALISLSNLSDERMRSAKAGEWYVLHPQRALANNSWCATEKPEVGIFMKEWLALYESKSGERGIFNREAARRQVLKYGRRDPDYEFGTNPCCVSAETPILTSEGNVPIRDRVGLPTVIWNGEAWAEVVPFEAGKADLYRVELSDGTYLDCTSNHKWVVPEGNRYAKSQKTRFVMTKDLTPGTYLAKFEMPALVVSRGAEDPEGDGYSQGFYSGDGNTDLDRSFLYDAKAVCASRLRGVITDGTTEGRKIWKHGPMLPKDFIPHTASAEYRLDWLAGLLDADGTVVSDKNGDALQLASTNKDFLLQVRLMLTTLGVQAKLNRMSDGGLKPLPDGNGGTGLYECQPCYRLLINQTDTYHLLNLGLQLTRLQVRHKRPQRDARRFVTVVSVTPLDRFEMTYCFEEPETHRGTFNGIVTGQSEIILRPQSFCNLSEVVARERDSFGELKEKVRLATILGTFQSTLTNFKYLRKVWKNNAEEERLLGVSMTGIMDCAYLRGCSEEELDQLRQHAVEVNTELALELGINPSAAITCVKPSGTVSQLVDSSSGIHSRHAPFYIRRVRADKKDPITQFMVDKGIPNEPCFMKPDTTVVFSFPQKAPEGAITRNDLTAIEQLEFWLKFQRGWCEHKPSITVTVREHEWPEVGAWVWEHFDEVSGISFLPHSEHNYKQAPYEEITEEAYKELLAKMPEKIDWTELSQYENEDYTVGSQTLACSANACELVDLI